jgi:CRP-like cAMP-binding protein
MMTGKKINCWEYNSCGREPNGENVLTHGVCPAADDNSYNGINSGVNAGRICWAVAGTFCNGVCQGTFAEKRDSCMSCDFFKLVREEEGEANKDSKFLRYITQNGDTPILEKMTYRHIESGLRFIRQGEIEDCAYIIQSGTCLAIVQKDGELYPVNHYGEGDIVGGVAILTGEPRLAHVEAETDMNVWVLKKKHFEDISGKDPELLNFFTELVADRFDSRRPIAYRTIGKYIATDIIGRGSFSVVYKGKHIDLEMPVAIKMMRHNLAMDPEFLENFNNEAKTIASLDHENIIRIYDIEERYKTVFIIMEYVNGESLMNLIQRLKLIPPELTAYYLVQACSGLSFAHENGIIHRDINPSNILLHKNDRLKIFDFGLACPIGTEDMEFLGTAFYMAPEQIKSYEMDQRTDIYSLGITAYEMVTGAKPYADKDIRVVMDKHVNNDIPDPAEAIPNLPQELRRFILKACQRDPKDRYQNATQAMLELLPLIDETRHLQEMQSDHTQKMVNIFLKYREEDQLAFTQLIEEFTTKAKELGVNLKIVDLLDL